MSYPVYSSKGTKADGTAVASVAPSYPATITAGDILFCVAILDDDAGNIQTPTGFSNVAEYQQTAIATDISSYLFYKIADGTETGTLTVSGASLSGGVADYIFAQIYRITGTDAAIADTDSTKGTSTTITWDAVSILNAESTLLALVVNWDAAGAPGTPTGYTLSASDTSSAISGLYVYLNSKANTSSGASVTATDGSSVGWSTYHVSLYNNIVTSSRSFIVN